MLASSSLRWPNRPGTSHLAATLTGLGVGFAFAAMSNLIVEAVPPGTTWCCHRHQYNHPHDRRRGRARSPRPSLRYILPDGLPRGAWVHVVVCDPGRCRGSRSIRGDPRSRSQATWGAASSRLPSRNPHSIRHDGVGLHRRRHRRLTRGGSCTALRARGGPAARARATVVCAWEPASDIGAIGEAFVPTVDVFVDAEHHAEETLRAALEGLQADPSVQVDAVSVEGLAATVLVDEGARCGAARRRLARPRCSEKPAARLGQPYISLGMPPCPLVIVLPRP